MPTENMTSEEAIQRLETITEEIYTWREELGEKLSERDRADINAYKVSIDALDKQIPKKPKMYVGEYEHERYPLCPACGGELMPNGEKYCSDCGQKILWED